MGKETAFWEAVIAVAPLLALTIVVELRALPWPRIRPGIKAALLVYMAASIILLTTSVTYSILKLLTWGSGISFLPQRPEDAPLVAAGIIFAAAGVMIVPVSMTMAIALGPALNPKLVTLARTHRATEKAFRRRLDSLLHRRHETRVELTERVLASNGDLFVPSVEGTPPRIADETTAALRRRSHRLHTRIRSTELAYAKWEKASSKRLNKARRRYTAQKATDLIAHRRRNLSAKAPRSHRSPYH